MQKESTITMIHGEPTTADKVDNRKRKPSTLVRIGRTAGEATLVLLLASGCAPSTEAPAPQGTSQAGEPTPDTPASSSSAEKPTLDALHATLVEIQKAKSTDQDLYPLPDKLQPDNVFGKSADQIDEIFGVTVDASTQSDPKTFMGEVVKQVFDDQNAMNRLGEATKAVNDSNDGHQGVVVNKLEETADQIVRATRNNPHVKQSPDARQNFDHITLARLDVHLIEHSHDATAAFPTVVGNFYDPATLKVTTGPDGKLSATVKARAVMSVDNNLASQVDGSDFATYDTQETWTIEGCSADKSGRVTCESITNTPDSK